MSDAKITLSAEDKTRAAFGDVKRNLESLRATAESFNSGFGRLGVAFGSAFAGVSLTAFVKATADGLDRLNDIKDATGASIEAISGLEDVAARTGTSIDVVTTSLIKFNAALTDSKAGSVNDNVFRALGLDVAALKQLDPAEALRQTAVALSRFADDGDKARVVQQLFGKSLREVAPFLNDLAQAGQLNAKVTAQQAEEAEKFNKQLAAASKNSVDFARAIVSDVLPALNNFLEKLQGINKSGGFFASIQKELRAAVVGDELKRVVAEIESIQATIDRQGGDNYLERKLRNLRTQAAALTKEGAELSTWLKNFAGQADPYGDVTRKRQEDRGFVPERPKLVVPEIVKPMTVKPGATNGMDLIPDALKEARKLIDDADINKVARYREQLQQLVDIAEASPDTPGVIDAISTLSTKIAELDPEYQAVIKAQKEMADLLAKTPYYKYEKLREQVVLLEQAFQDGKFGLVGSIEAADAFQAAVAEMAKNAIEDTKKAVGEMDEFSRQAARNIQDALGDTLKSSLRGDFASIGKLWTDLIFKMTAEAAAAKIGQALLGDFGKTGEIGGIFGDGLSWLSNVIGIGRADGGPVNPRSLQRVNERGFEVFTDPMGQDWLMTGARGGYVTPSNQVRGAMGADQASAAPAKTMQQVNHFHVSGPIDRRTQHQVAAQVGRAAQQALARG